MAIISAGYPLPAISGITLIAVNAIATPIQRERFRRDEFAANFIKEIIEAQNIWLEKCKLNAA